jgi:hypothetical protein
MGQQTPSKGAGNTQPKRKLLTKRVQRVAPHQFRPLEGREVLGRAVGALYGIAVRLGCRKGPVVAIGRVGMA